jgi:diketogulonate reductase-like aldo/keto reductase
MHQVVVVVLVQVLQGLGRDRVDAPLSLIGDGSLKAVLLDPEDDFRLADMESKIQISTHFHSYIYGHAKIFCHVAILRLQGKLVYIASTERYTQMIYRRCGRSGLLLPAISLGLWHNFGGASSIESCRTMLSRAFDLGITHFDLANNYGPPYGSAEETFGRLFQSDLAAYRDELILSTKAGYDMWPGPYGNWGSRKYLLASLDQSLRRMGLEYVDIFYSHRPDPSTPLEETMSALAFAVRSGKALYAGISNHNPEQTAEAAAILRSFGTPCLIHQMRYSIFQRTPEAASIEMLGKEGMGGSPFRLWRRVYCQIVIWMGFRMIRARTIQPAF